LRDDVVLGMLYLKLVDKIFSAAGIAPISVENTPASVKEEKDRLEGQLLWSSCTDDGIISSCVQ